jgi:hypothetical protein
MQDNYGNEITVEGFVVLFQHATGFGIEVMFNHQSITSRADVDDIVKNLRRCRFVNPEVLEWTDRFGVHCPADLP